MSSAENSNRYFDALSVLAQVPEEPSGDDCTFEETSTPPPLPKPLILETDFSLTQEKYLINFLPGIFASKLRWMTDWE